MMYIVYIYVYNNRCIDRAIYYDNNLKTRRETVSPSGT